jgi:hypothetical protein
VIKSHSFNRWIFHSYSGTPEGFGIFRIVFSSFLLFFLIPGNGAEHFEFISSIPSEFYNPPPGPLQLLSGYPELIVFRLLRLVIILSAVSMMLGFFTKKASIITGITILLLQGGIYSVGKVNHEILIGMVPLLMAYSNWGAAYSADEFGGQVSNRNIETWPVTLLSIFLGFMMFTAGFPKILGGWLDLTTQATQGHLMNQYFENGRQALLAPYAVATDSAFFWELLDWATIIFEVGFIFVVWKPRLFKMIAGIAVLFHFSTMMLLNIAFLPNFALYALFLNWTAIHRGLDWFFSRGGNAKKYIYTIVTGFSILFFGGLKWMSTQNLVLKNSDLTLHEAVIVIIAFFIVIAVVVRRLFRRFRQAA